MSGPYLEFSGARLEPPWQGIERVSMELDTGGFAAVVTVHLAQPANGVTAADIEVAGGRRIVGLQPEVVVTGGSELIELRFSEKGDRSDYFVRLLSGGADPLHPFFAQAAFNFFVDCESGDCRPRALGASRQPEASPPVDLSRKDYTGFLQMLTEWVRVRNPAWADLSPASLERMLIELLAHQADLLSYYQDRVANEAFIETASQRYSLRQHAALLGHRVFEGCAAETTLSFQVTNGGFVPLELAVQAPRLPEERPTIFTVTERVRVDPLNNAYAPADPQQPHLRPAAWPGASGARIAAGARQMLLWSHDNALAPGMRLAFTQDGFWQIVTLETVERREEPGWTESPADPLAVASSAVTALTWAEPLRAALEPWSGAAPLRIHGNLVEARHGAARVWRLPAAASQPGPADLLNRRNSIVVDQLLGDGSTRPLLRALLVPEGPVLYERIADGEAETPALELLADEPLETWTREEHLLNSSSFDAHYVASADNDGRVWIELGDGNRGRAIEFDRQKGLPAVPIEVRYRIGEAVDGACGLDALTELVQPPPATTQSLGTIAVTNVRPSGGLRPATLNEIREAIPESLKHGALERAVALDDYAEAAKQIPGVERAAARALGGVFNTVIVLIDPHGSADLDEELRRQVYERIDRLRMAGREHFVEPAVYISLEVSLAICPETGYLRHEVRDRVLAELRPGTQESPGYFHPDKLSFDQEVELGDLLAFVQRLDGVHAVKAETFRRLRDKGPEVVSRIELGRLEVARLDADENFPELGKLTVHVIGLHDADETAFSAAGPVAGGAP